MHIASVNTEEEQNNIREHIQSLGKFSHTRNHLLKLFAGLGHEHFWTSGTDQAEEGKIFWMSTGKPLTYENWNTGEPKKLYVSIHVITSLKWRNKC